MTTITRYSLGRAALVVLVLVVLLCAFVASPHNYDTSSVHSRNGCYIHETDQDAILAAALLVRQHYGRAELRRQRRLDVSFRQADEVVVSGSPLITFLPMFGGGAVDVLFSRQGDCLKLQEISLEK